MHIPRNRTKFILGLFIVSLIFIILRLKTLNHLLMWDEARNIIVLRAFLSNNTTDPFYWNYFFHPPLYMTFASTLSPFKAGLDMRLELLSLSFSYLTLLVVYILSARLGGWKYAFLSGLFLSLMPVSIAYDTWIKRDCLASVLGYLAILLLFKKKVIWCAVALSFSMLAKENASFFILAVTALLFALKEEKIPKKLAIIYGTVFALVSWWYLFLSTMPKLVFDIYISAEKNARTWVNSPIYYCGKLLPDMGLPMLIFFIIGAGYLLHLIFLKKQYRWSLPLIVALSVYITGSLIIACKTPWFSLPTVPALAMVAGGGALFLLRIAKKYKFFSIIFILLLILSTIGGFSFSYTKYHIDTYTSGWLEANCSRETAIYLNKTIKIGEGLMLTRSLYLGAHFCPVSPVFLYYLGGRHIYIIDYRNSAEEVIREIIANKVSWLAAMDSPDKQFDFHALVKNLEDSVLGKPVFVGGSRIWKTDILWRRSTNPIRLE